MSVNNKLNAGPASSQDEIVLVTGASGFIASHIIKQLLERGYRVRGTVRNLNDYRKVFPLKNLVQSPKHELELFEANLNDPCSWLSPVKDCTYVIHTASILSKSSPRDDENEIVRPTVDSLLSILKACVQEESKVKRVILTSSLVTITGDYFENNKTYSEKDRPEVERQTAYTRSKILAERAAWNFVRDREHNGLPCFDISFINPGYVLGPLLTEHVSQSVETLRRLLLHKIPFIALPNIYLPTCDVRDVALAHIRAMTLDTAVSERHIIVNAYQTQPFKEWGIVLKEEFGDRYWIPTHVMPNILVRLYSFFDRSAREKSANLGKKVYFDNRRMLEVLFIKPIELRKTLIDTVNSMIERNILPVRYSYL